MCPELYIDQNGGVVRIENNSIFYLTAFDRCTGITKSEEDEIMIASISTGRTVAEIEEMLANGKIVHY
jgi:hypothetical protein